MRVWETDKRMEYQLVKSDRKTMAIQVGIDGTVTVRVPKRCSKKLIEDFVQEHRTWICKKQEELGRRAREREKRREGMPEWSQEDYQQHRTAAGRVLRERAEYFARQMGVSFERISIRDQKTRWGSCSTRGNLNFNWRLILAPLEILDYVVVHELAHRKEMNHSERFWRLVAQVLPDYQERKQWLKENGDLLMSGVVFRGSYFSQGGVPKDTLWKKGSPDLGFRMQKL